jgi:hypothetical protein
MSNSTIDVRLKSVFELSDEELQERLRPTFEAVQEKKFAKGGYITYYDPVLCPTNAYAVHEYRDRKDLMWMDGLGKAHFVKTL